MSPEQLPNASVGFTYEVTLAAANPPGPVSWTVIEGALPAGLMLDEATGVLAGVPESAGVFGFDVKGVSGNRLAFARYLLTVENPSVAVNVAVDALLGVPGALTSELERFLDLRGNQNGFLDVGDLRALMREQNVLQASRMRSESAESR